MPPLTSPTLSVPKVSSITRNRNNFANGELDFGHMDIWVDDGNSDGLDSHTRQMRFSYAASNVDSLFRSPRSSFAEVEEDDVFAFKEIAEKSPLSELPMKKSLCEQELVDNQIHDTQVACAIQLTDKRSLDMSATHKVNAISHSVESAEHLRSNDQRISECLSNSSEAACKKRFKKLLKFFEMGAVEAFSCSDSIHDAITSNEHQENHKDGNEVITANVSQPDLSLPSRSRNTLQNSGVGFVQLEDIHEIEREGAFSIQQNEHQDAVLAINLGRSIKEAGAPTRSTSVIDIEPLTLSDEARGGEYSMKRDLDGNTRGHKVGRACISGGELLLSKTSAESSPDSFENVTPVRKIGHGVNTMDVQRSDASDDVRGVSSSIGRSDESRVHLSTFDRLKKLSETVRLVVSGEVYDGHSSKPAPAEEKDMEQTRSHRGVGRVAWNIRGILPRLRLTNMLSSKEHGDDAGVDTGVQSNEEDDAGVKNGDNDMDQENMGEDDKHTVSQQLKEETASFEVRKREQRSGSSTKPFVVPPLPLISADISEKTAGAGVKKEPSVAGNEATQVGVTEKISGTENSCYTPNESSWMVRRLLSPRNSMKDKKTTKISAKDMASWPANAPTLYICTENGPCIIGEPSPWAPKHVRDAVSFRATDLKNEDSLINLNAKQSAVKDVGVWPEVNEKKALPSPRQAIAKLINPIKRLGERNDFKNMLEHEFPNITRTKNRDNIETEDRPDSAGQTTSTATTLPERITEIFTPRVRSHQRDIEECNVLDGFAHDSGESTMVAKPPVTNILNGNTKRNAVDNNAAAEDVAKTRRNKLVKLSAPKVTAESPKTAFTNEQAWIEDEKAGNERAVIVGEGTTPTTALRNRLMKLRSPRAGSPVSSSAHVIPSGANGAKATQLEERLKDEFGVVASGETEAEVDGAVNVQDMLEGLEPDPARGVVVSGRGAEGRQDEWGNAGEYENSWLPNWGVRRLLSQFGLRNGS